MYPIEAIRPAPFQCPSQHTAVKGRGKKHQGCGCILRLQPRVRLCRVSTSRKYWSWTGLDPSSPVGSQPRRPSSVVSRSLGVRYWSVGGGMAAGLRTLVVGLGLLFLASDHCKSLLKKKVDHGYGGWNKLRRAGTRYPAAGCYLEWSRQVDGTCWIRGSRGEREREKDKDKERRSWAAFGATLAHQVPARLLSACDPALSIHKRHRAHQHHHSQPAFHFSHLLLSPHHRGPDHHLQHHNHHYYNTPLANNTALLVTS